MDDLKSRFKESCPRKLKDMPTRYCPLAVKRLKYLRTLDKDLTPEEDVLAIGCPHAVFHQLSNYCYFVYESHNICEGGIGDQEIAKILNISIDSVKESTNSGLNKIKSSDFVLEIKEIYGTDKVVDDSLSIEDETIYS